MMSHLDDIRAQHEKGILGLLGFIDLPVLVCHEPGAAPNFSYAAVRLTRPIAYIIEDQLPKNLTISAYRSEANSNKR
jgi:hypothetical protein